MQGLYEEEHENVRFCFFAASFFLFLSHRPPTMTVEWVYGISIAWIAVSGVIYVVPEPPARIACTKRPGLFLYRSVALLLTGWYVLFAATAMLASTIGSVEIKTGAVETADNRSELYALAAILAFLLTFVLLGIGLVYRGLQCCCSCLCTSLRDRTFEEHGLEFIASYFLAGLFTNFLASNPTMGLSIENAGWWLLILLATWVAIRLLSWLMGKVAAQLLFSIIVGSSLAFAIAFVAYPDSGWIEISAQNNWLLLLFTLALALLHILYTLCVRLLRVYEEDTGNKPKKHNGDADGDEEDEDDAAASGATLLPNRRPPPPPPTAEQEEERRQSTLVRSAAPIRRL